LRASWERIRRFSPGGTIRTLSVSLLAMAAVFIGVIMNRFRPPTRTVPAVDSDVGVEDTLQLEALRRAGF
jgi:hypothetical protein